MDRNMALFFLSFFLIFTGFETSQQYLSSIFYTKNIELISFISISLIYISLAASTFVAPSICRKLGLKKSLFISSLFYPLFILSIVSGMEIFIYISSILLGIAASVLWTAQGTYLTVISDSKKIGFYSGMFFSIVFLGTAAMVFSASYFIENINYVIIYSALFIIALLGSFATLTLSNKGKMKQYKLQPKNVITKKTMKLFIPFMFSASFIFGLAISSFPIRVTDLFGLDFVGKISAIIILTVVVVPIFMGRLSDKYGFSKFIYLSLISGIVGFIVLFFSTDIISFGFGAFLAAFCYACFLFLAYPVLSSYFKKEIDSAMAIRVMIQSVGIFTAVISNIFLGFHELLIIGGIVFIISLVSSRYLFSIKPTDKK